MNFSFTIGAVAAWALLQAPLDAPLEEPPPKDGPHQLALGTRVELRGVRTLAASRDVGAPPEAIYGLGLNRLQIEVGYRYEKWLRAVAEVDLAELPGIRPEYVWPEDEADADRPEPIKDVYLRLGPKRLAVRAGHFKPPISGIESESSWDLPTARRGILHSALADYMRFAGRRPGVQLEWSPDLPLEPKLVAGAFQGSEADGSLLRSVGVYETNLAARGSVRPGPVEVGISGALVGTPPYAGAAVGRYWLVDLDASAQLALGPVALRGWGEVAYGLSFHGLYGALGQDANFTAGRLLLAVRYGGASQGTAYGELFGMAEGVNFDLTAEARTLAGYVLGVNVGLWDRARLTIQAEVREVGEHSPALSSGGNLLRERTVVLAQVGGVFDDRWRFGP